MALRTIRVQGDPVLEKICKPVKELTPRTKELIEDMLDTMYEANGVGLAAPQVGILNMEEYEIEGTELMARAMCHEIDHLDGHLYVEKVEGQLHDVTYEEEE